MTATETPNDQTDRGPVRRLLDGAITGWRLLPFVAVLIATNVAAWFRLESIADARARDACTDIAEIHTALRDAFALVADLFPQAEALQTLTDAIDAEFPLAVEDCAT